MSVDQELEQSETVAGDSEAETKTDPIITEDYKDQYLRALADYQNLLRQTQKEKTEFFRYALADFLADLLPVYDNLKMSIANLKEDEQKSPWVEGVKYVLKQFKDILTERGVEEIKTVGEKFDHETMEAVEGEGELVEREIKAGYKLNGKVISPAKVIVKK
jgi:molecular chaperone GrpE